MMKICFHLSLRTLIFMDIHPVYELLEELQPLTYITHNIIILNENTENHFILLRSFNKNRSPDTFQDFNYSCVGFCKQL